MKKIDPYLKSVLDNFTANYFANRERAFAGLDFEKLRDELAKIRDQALEKNQELLQQFTEQAEMHGSKVILAKSSEEANQAVLTVLRKHRVKKLVKTKSMVSEETRLNDFLLGNEIEVRETDLGEWIVQLSEDHPTHMVLPAIHLNRKDVARIFSQKLGREIPENPQILVQTAREELRKEIFSAGAGLTGANALIADTGAMMMITNEGNGRLVSTIPPLQIVFTSIEKLYANLAEVLVLLRMLPRNATGQIITSYVSFIAGPHRSGQYIILVDNHRSELMADRVFGTTLRCIKCSACLNICPVYRLLGGRQYGYVYMGGIGALLTAWLHGLRESRELVSLCLNCHRCDEICAVKIPISGLIVSLREKLNQELGKPFFKELIFDGIIAQPRLHQGLFKLARLVRPLIKSKENFTHELPPPFHKYDRFRSLPTPAEKPLSELWKNQSPSPQSSPLKGEGEQIPCSCSTAESSQLFSPPWRGGDKGEGEISSARKQNKVKIFAGCLIEHFYPEVGISARQVLHRLGYQIDLIETSCCGFPAQNAGFKSPSEKALSQLLEKIRAEEPIITLCPTCTEMLRSAGEKFKELVLPFSQFLFEKEFEPVKEMFADKKPSVKINYHESCHQKHSLHASEASREILKLLAGENFVELKNADSCCGFAGFFSLAHPELSEAFLSEKISALKESGAEILALDCPGCLLQFKGGCHQARLSIRIHHIAEILAEEM